MKTKDDFVFDRSEALFDIYKTTEMLRLVEIELEEFEAGLVKEFPTLCLGEERSNVSYFRHNPERVALLQLMFREGEEIRKLHMEQKFSD